jgi:hypothetical protein
MMSSISGLQRQRNERLAVGLFIAGAVIVTVLVVVVASH